MASINLNYEASIYPSGVTLPEVYAYDRATFLTATATPNAPELRGLSDARFVWTSEASGGNVTKGARIFLGGGANLPQSARVSGATVRVYAKLKVNETDRLDEVHLRYQTENRSVDSGDLISQVTTAGDDTWVVVDSSAYTNQDLSSDKSIYATLNVSGTDTSGNVGLTILDVEYLAVEVTDGH